ncbi:MAG: hypothetical protein OXE99_10685 [Cellvibrionales bacterium]|nr:hypothetical protein [Cellvibrionales bacterium]
MDSKVFSREEFRLVREARQLIKEEFDEVISLTSHNLRQEIYHFALESEHEHIFAIFEKVYQSDGQAPARGGSGIQAKRYYRGAVVD